jgi:DNA mismatch endonuclease (patch repair protein)
MPDVFTKEKRSWVMSRIRGKGTKPELFVERLLVEKGITFEKHPKMFGKPDFLLPEYSIVIFTDGDFWHGYRMGPKKLAVMSEFWRVKISGNKARDRRVNAFLRREGWTIVRVWEHDIRRKPEAVVARILGLLTRT